MPPHSFWPHPQCRVRKAKQILSACAVDRLHGHALKEGRHKSGKIGGIRTVRKVTFRFGSFKSPPQCVLLLDSQSDELSADRLTFHTTSQGCLDCHTATPRPPLSKKLGRPAQDTVRDGERRRLVESVMHECNGSCQISCQSFFKQCALVPKRLIEACRLDSHRSREVIQRGALEALAPKDMHGAIQSFVIVEAARTACALCQSHRRHFCQHIIL